MKQGTAIIIGAGPAGLTAAIELQRRSEIKPILLEASQEIGGISRTVRYKGNRMDIGGHRFFSKSDRVMRWWLDLMPVEAGSAQDGELRYQGQQRESLSGHGGSRSSNRRPRHAGPPAQEPHLFPAPLLRLSHQPDRDNLQKSWAWSAPFVAASVIMRSALLPQREERSLEDFIINRFGKQLYLTFFKSYTEKVWGVPCNEISAEWGAQRIKGLSLKGVVTHFLKKTFGPKESSDIAQKKTETSLIEKFLYPKFGPGQLWEHAAGLVKKGGGEIHLGIQIDRINVEGNKVVSVEGRQRAGERLTYAGDYFFSTMPVRDLVRAFSTPVPAEVAEVSEGLMYRDFITVGLLASKLTVTEKDGAPLKDNWIYIQEPDVTGRPPADLQ